MKQLGDVRKTNLENLQRSFAAGDAKVGGYPTRLMIEPTNVCDLKCPYCPTGTGTMDRANGFLTFDNFKRAVDDLMPYLTTVVTWNYGEPFLNKQINKMFRYAADLDLVTVCSTNGHPFHHRFPEGIQPLLDSGIDRLMISIDGATAATHEKYRIGSDLDAVVKGLRFFIEERNRQGLKKPHVDLQFIVFKHNEDEVPAITQLAKDIGVDSLSLKSANLTMADVMLTDLDADKAREALKERVNEDLPSDAKHARYDEDGQVIGLPEKGCARLYEMVVVNWDGKVSPCCYDVNAKFDLGNAFEVDIKKLWNGPNYTDLRSKVAQSRQLVPMCSVCTYGAGKVRDRMAVGKEEF
jgi:radical SAM protein with 4Fe4S-binding SPASM domain